LPSITGRLPPRIVTVSVKGFRRCCSCRFSEKTPFEPQEENYGKRGRRLHSRAGNAVILGSTLKRDQERSFLKVYKAHTGHLDPQEEQRACRPSQKQRVVVLRPHPSQTRVSKALVTGLYVMEMGLFFLPLWTSQRILTAGVRMKSAAQGITFTLLLYLMRLLVCACEKRAQGDGPSQIQGSHLVES